MRAGARKQAFVPVGAAVLEPVGTAPGLLVGARPLVAVLPGRRASCRRCGRLRWRRSPLRELLASRGDVGAADPALLPAARAADRGDAARDRATLPFEVTTCLRRGELEVATVFAPSAAGATRRSRRSCARATATSCSPTTARRSTRSSRGCSPGSTIATAESCTGGLMAGRLTDLAGSSAYVLGGLVVYSNEAKTALAGVAGGVDRGARRGLAGGRHGAVGRRAVARWAPTSASGSPASPARAAARPRSRSAPSASRSRRRRRRGAHRAPAGRPRRRPRPHDHRRAPHAARAPAASARAVAAAAAPARRDPLRSSSRSTSPTALARRPRGARRAADQDVWRPVARRGAARHARVPRQPPAGGRGRDRAGRRRRARGARALALGDVLLLPPRRARVLTVALDDPAVRCAALQARVAARSPPRASTRPRSARSART